MNMEAALSMQRKCRYRSSIELFREIVAREPKNIQAQAGLALSLAAVKEYEQARQAAERALALNKNCDYAHLALALICHAERQKEKFVDEVERAFYIKPFVFDVASKYAQLLADENDATSALPVFEEMLEADDAKECRHYLYALALYQLRKPKLAIQQSLVALRRVPSAKAFVLVLKVLFVMLPLVSIPLTLVFLASLAGLMRLGFALPWYGLTIFILSYIFFWGLAGALALSQSGTSNQKQKRSRLLLGVTLIDVGIFLSILSFLLFQWWRG